MRKLIVRIASTLLVLIVAIIIGHRLWVHYMYSPWTRDGRIRADIVAVAPDVAGLVTAVAVGDNQHVHRGDILFTVDAARYELAIARAEAALVAARTDYELKRAEAGRRAQLDAAVVSKENRESTQATAAAAAAHVQEAQAALDLARLNLERANVRATVDGYVTNLNVHVGDYAQIGKPILAVVNEHSFHVEGYFEETKLEYLQIGDAVDIRLMSGNKQLHGVVVSFARAIAEPETEGLLSAVNPTFHWVRLAQRIPVRIDFKELPKDIAITAGMTCTLVVRPKSVRS